MTTYYIDPTASVNGNGAIDTPFNTPPGTLAAGNEYLGKAGAVLTAAHWYISHSGEDGNRIRIGSYGEGDHPFCIDGLGARQYGFQLATNVAYIDFEDIELRGQTLRGFGNFTTSGSPTVGTHLRLRRLHVHHQTESADGIFIYGAGNLVEQVRVHDIPNDGIWASCDGLIIRRAHVWRVAQDDLSNGDCIQFSGDAGDFLLDRCYLDHSDKPAKHCLIVSGSSDTGGTVRSTVMHGHNDVLHITLYLDQGGVLVEDCHLTGGAVCGNSGGAGTRYIGNWIVNPYGRGLDINSQDSQALHNRIEGGGTIGIRNNSAATGVLLHHNEINGFTQGMLVQAATESYNAVWDCDDPFVDETGDPISAGTGSTTSAPTVHSIAMSRTLAWRERFTRGRASPYRAVRLVTP
jgi:hypothetical protein